ncbi:MAG: hypothetical protein GY861_11300 [bacterium]|nr:hypothetical protein [bacterium]
MVKEHTYNKRIHLTKEEKSALQGVVRSGGDLLEGFPDHNDLSGLQGGTTNEYYHLTQADYLESVNFFDGGSTTRTGVDSHIADSAIHKTEFDETVYTHTSGKLTQEVDKLATATVGTHNTTYNSEGRVNTVVVDSGTWTFTYNGDGTLAGTIKT